MFSRGGFESSVILQDSKTVKCLDIYPIEFESSVILQDSKTNIDGGCSALTFESSVILQDSKTKIWLQRQLTWV